ncbi:hypothetical protein [Abyssibacter sp.]|uniref:pPIWI-associating nuclease domain-containing protein n=1 Tax=Abyssibacter sp. TaxID=2320200 RepID=UPI003510DC38
MIDDISKALRGDFEERLFAAALRNLEDSSNPLRLNNFAYAMRELTRHLLHRLAPDESVNRCPWYKNETRKENGITRKQRAIYATQGGLSDAYVRDILQLEVEDIHADLVKAISGLSKLTHIERSVFDLPAQQVDSLADEAIVAVYDFVRTIFACRNTIIDQLWEQIDSAVIDETLRETIVAIDELASHSYIDAVYTERVDIVAIDHESINFSAQGTIECELQWGSNSDLRRGDGAVLPESFPFQCELFSPIGAPGDVVLREDSFGVDTGSWSDVRYGQDEQA